MSQVSNLWYYDKLESFRKPRKIKLHGIVPPKGKRDRDTLFDPILQEAIKKLIYVNGQHEFVFSYKDGTTPGAKWFYEHFQKWLKRAGIEPTGRKIVPHSARHSLALLRDKRL